MPDTAAREPLTVTVTCHVCGTVACATLAEADRRAERHTKVTGHATTTEARCEPGGAT